MPSKPKYRTRKRRKHSVPSWVAHYCATGVPPERGTAAWFEYVGWLYLGDCVTGLNAPGRADLHARATLGSIRNNPAG